MNIVYVVELSTEKYIRTVPTRRHIRLLDRFYFSNDLKNYPFN